MDKEYCLGRMELIKQVAVLQEKGWETKDIAEHIKLSEVTVTNYLTNGIRVLERLNEQVRGMDNIVKEYEEEGDIGEVARKTGLSYVEVYKILVREGLIDRFDRVKLVKGLLDYVSDITWEEVRRQTGYSDRVLKRLIREEDLGLDTPSQRKKKEKVDVYLEDYHQLGSLNAVAEKHGVTRQAVSAFLKDNSKEYQNGSR